MPKICSKGSYWTLNKEFGLPKPLKSSEKQKTEKIITDSSGTTTDVYGSTEGQSTNPKSIHFDFLSDIWFSERERES